MPLCRKSSAIVGEPDSLNFSIVGLCNVFVGRLVILREPEAVKSRWAKGPSNNLPTLRALNKGFLDLSQSTSLPDGRKFWDIPLKDHKGNSLRLWVNMGFVIPKGKTKADRRPYARTKAIWGQQSDDSDKVILIEELLWDDGRKEIRLGYYTTTADSAPKRSGVWTWGQFALMAPEADLKELLAFAKEKGFLA